MAKSLHRTLEAKLASMKDPPSDSESEEERAETISAVTATGKDGKRKERRKRNVKSKSAIDKDIIDTNQSQPSNVIFLGHLPVGFEDREINVFLNQFGNVHRCRVSRSTKTGRSRGYAFVEFADAEVAKIVAETMSGYFLFEKRLVCHVLPMDKVHENMFSKSKRILTKKDRQKVARTECNKRRSAEAMKEITAKLVKREGMKRKRLEELGIEYDFPGYVAASVQSSVVTEGGQQKVSKVAEEDDKDVDGENSHEVKTTKSKKKKVTKSGVTESEKKQMNNDVVTENNVVEAVLDAETKSVTKRSKRRKNQTEATKKAKAAKSS